MFLNVDHTFAVCAYGESPYLEECLASLRAQTIKSNILISTSTPNNRITSLANKYDIELFVNEGDPGIAHDWNCAIEHCDTPLVTIAHQDDVYLPNYAETMLDMINRAPHPLIWFSDYGELRNTVPRDESALLRIKRIMLYPLKTPSTWNSKFVRRRVLSLGSSICCPSVTLCRPNLPDPIFLDDMKCDLDWEAWERFSQLDGSFVYAPQLLMRHRIHENSETTALIKDDTRTQEDLLMFQRFWPKPIAYILNQLYSISQRSNE